MTSETVRDSSDTALRIVAAISQASKMGIEIPRAINDFADGAMRLQNSIESIDDAIDYLQKDVKALNKTFLGENMHETFVIDAEIIRDDANKKKDLSRKKDPQTERYEKEEKELEGCFADEKQGKDLKASFEKLKELHKTVIEAEGSNAQIMHEEEEKFINILNSINYRRLVKLLTVRKADDYSFSAVSESSFQEVMGDTIHSKMWSVMWQMGIPKASGMLAERTWENIKSFF